MKLTDHELHDLIKQSARSRTDVFLQLCKLPRAEELGAFAEALREPVAVLLPCAVYGCAPENVLRPAGALPLPAKNTAYYMDIRELMDDETPRFFGQAGIRTLILPFYECAAPAEYGYKMSCGAISNLRAALPFDIHVTAVSRGDYLTPEVFEALGTVEYILAGEECPQALNAVKTENARAAMRFAAEQYEKYFLKRIIIECPTRTRAEDMNAYLLRRGASPALFHGGRTRAENETAVSRFAAGTTNVLIATKSLLGAYPFLQADKLFYLGLPYSLSHAGRLTALCGGKAVTAVYCDEDEALIRKLTAGFAETLGLTDGALIRRREEMLRAVLAAAENEAP